MTILFPAGDTAAAIVDRSRRLAADIERLSAAGRPTLDDLADAPILDMWRPVRRLSVGLIGIVRRHPSLADGRVILTSEVFALNGAGDDTKDGAGGFTNATWARSFSRFYVLGRPIDDISGRRR
jgi:hypothetical protein